LREREREIQLLVLLHNTALRLDTLSPDKVKQAKVQNVLQGLSMKRHLKRFWQSIKYFNLRCWVWSCLGHQALSESRLYCFSPALVTLKENNCLFLTQNYHMGADDMEFTLIIHDLWWF